MGPPVTATDGDGDDILTYTLSGPDAASFTIEQADGDATPATDGGEIRVKDGAELDHETNPTLMVTVTATDSGRLFASIDVTITVTNVNEAPEIMKADSAPAAPMFPGQSATRTVAENTPANQAIGNPVRATDPNGDQLTYMLGGADAASFTIDLGTGQLKTKAALDHETKDTYTVMVTATDSGGLNATVKVTINVNDVAEEGPQSLLARYDANGNDQVDLDEVFRGIDDYFDYADRITLEEVYELVDLYFES